MKVLIVAAAVAAAFLAGCERSENTASSKAPASASGGATAGAASKTGPAGDTTAQPPAANSGGTSAEAKPDPGDANDHSNPQHDAKSKKRGD